MKQYAGTSVMIGLWILLLSIFIYFLNIGQIKPIENSQMITAGKLCNDQSCSDFSNIELPFFVPMAYSSGKKIVNLQFSFDHQRSEDHLQAIYIPKVADNVSVFLNDEQIRHADILSRSWNRPIFIQFSSRLLKQNQNIINLVLVGNPQEGLELQPFYVGTDQPLKFASDLRDLIGIGVARFGLGLMIILFIVMGGVWLARREERAYLWLSLSCLSACGYLVHYGFDVSAFPFKYWTIFWASSIYLYVFFIAKFINKFLILSDVPLEKFILLIFTISNLIFLMLPAEYAFRSVILISVVTALVAHSVLVIFWQNRHTSSRIDFILIFGLNSLSYAIGASELFHYMLDEPPRNMHLLQFMPLLMSSVCLWLIMSRLIRSLLQFEQLTTSLNDTIEVKTQELSQTYKNLAEAEKHRAIDEERQRIMLDLHDGIGGQLVNTLAYMENKQVGDETLRTALEEALQDLALMLDSLENDDSISTLLGMLRTRLESLLEVNGLEFDWRIGEEPILPNNSPSQNLHLARIVQESVTNIIKHANASVITVATTASSVTIGDNGTGFDVKNLSEQQGKHGIAGMRRRAAQIGGQLELKSSKNGTQIKLVLP